MTPPRGTTIDFESLEMNGRKHICRTCSKGFSRSEHRIRHERRHTQEKPYACEICQKRYSRKDLLVRHQRTIHAEEQLRGKKNVVVQLPSTPPMTQSNSSIDSNIETLLVAGEEGQSQTPSVDESIFVDITYSEVFPEFQVGTEEVPPKCKHQTQSGNHTQHNISRDAHSDWINLLDPLVDWSSQQMADFALPLLNDQLMEGFSPLDELQSSAQKQNAFQANAASGVWSDAYPTTNVFQSNSLEASGVDVRATTSSQLGSVPQVVKHNCSTTVILFTESMRQNLLAGLPGIVSSELLQLVQPFSAKLFERCLQRYIEVFHTHVPIFHLPSLNIGRAPTPLVLSICAIGAIYRMERKIAAILYNIAQQSLKNMDPTGVHQLNRTLLQEWIKPGHAPGKPESTPLWKSQTTYLLTVFETLSGDPELSSLAINQMGFCARDYRTRLIWLQTHNTHLNELSWESWVERESVKRLLYAYMYLCNLNTMLFGLTAGFSMLTDGKVEMPCHHTLWDSSNAEEWRLLASSRGYSSLLLVKDAVSRLLNGGYPKDIPEQFWSWDPYSCNVAVNAVSIYISHMVQGSHFLAEVPIGAEESSTQRSIITNQMETAISRCLLLIKESRARADDSYTWDETEGPLLFNSLALLRVSYCKIMTRAESAGRAMFFREDEADFESSIKTFLQEPLEWNIFLTRAVSVALESIMMPAKIGSLLVRKTAAFTWGIEHAFSSWDSILLLTKWLYVVEQRKRQGFTLQNTERQIVEKVFNMLTEESDLITTEQCLAAALARFWAGIYDEVWVWGVTPKMGAMLRELANHYEAEHLLLSVNTGISHARTEVGC